MFATIDSPTLLGAAAVISALGGMISTVMALRKSRNEEHEECLEHLKECRAEAEKLAKELHDLKMGERVRSSTILATVGAAGFLGAGGLAAAAISQSNAPPPQKTVTVDVGTGATGPTGPPGPPGPKGDPGTFECLDGYVPGILVLNAPGGQTKIYTCIEQ